MSTRDILPHVLAHRALSAMPKRQPILSGAASGIASTINKLFKGARVIYLCRETGREWSEGAYEEKTVFGRAETSENALTLYLNDGTTVSEDILKLHYHRLPQYTLFVADGRTGLYVSEEIAVEDCGITPTDQRLDRIVIKR